MKIFVFGYYGYKNTGDDAMGLAISKTLKHNVVMFNRGDSILRTVFNVISSQVVAVGGGAHLRNWGKRWWYCSSRVLLLGIVCRLLLKRFYMMNVGSGGKRLDWLARLISNKLYQRDNQTMDSAVLLDFNPQRKEKILGINLHSISSVYYDNETLDNDLMLAVCRSVNEWKEQNKDWKVMFISFNGNEYYPDDEICYKASQLVKGSLCYMYNPDVTGLLSDFSKLSAFVGMRYHSLVFAYMTDTPFIAIQTYPRCRNFNRAINNLYEPITMEHIFEGVLTRQLLVLTHSRLNAVDYWLPKKEAKLLALMGLNISNV